MNYSDAASLTDTSPPPGLRAGAGRSEAWG